VSRAANAIAILVALNAGCGNRQAPTGAGSAQVPSAKAAAGASAAPDEAASGRSPSNPLGLPAAKLPDLKDVHRVFTFTDQMLAAARPGATLALTSATIAPAGVDGEDLVVDGPRGQYKVNPRYVIAVPDKAKLRIGEPVLTEHNGLMRHAVVLRFVKDQDAAIRFTDLPGKPLEVTLSYSPYFPPSSSSGSGGSKDTKAKPARWVRQAEGLAPGNYAALRGPDGWSHVLLVSASGEAPARQWFALGFGGAATIVDEADLHPIPIKWHPKLGSTVWAESSGVMRRGTVQTIDEPGIYTVRFERAGRPVTVGWGFVMPPIEEAPSHKPP
jgi:hypothetical protein